MSAPESKPKPKFNPFGNSLPQGDARELGENTGWAMWDQAVERTEKQFADTAPMTAPFPPSGGDRRYAKTEPSPLPPKDLLNQPPPKRAVREVTIDDVMVEARKANRVCPKPMWWEEMYARLPDWGGVGAALPRPPLAGDSWDRTPALAKRMSFRDHVEWCEKERCLQQLLDYLRALPEDGWHHMGE